MTQCQDGLVEMAIEELEVLLATERKHFILVGLARCVQPKLLTELLTSLLSLFKEDKPLTRENTSTLVNECVSALSMQEVSDNFT